MEQLFKKLITGWLGSSRNKTAEPAIPDDNSREKRPNQSIDQYRLHFMGIPYLGHTRIAILPSKASIDLKKAFFFLESKSHAKEFINYIIEYASQKQYQIFIHNNNGKLIVDIEGLENWHGIYFTEKVDISKYDNEELWNAENLEALKK
jgi:hypothetical protein